MFSGIDIRGALIMFGIISFTTGGLFFGGLLLLIRLVR